MFDARRCSALVVMLGMVVGSQPSVQAGPPQATEFQVTTMIADVGEGDHALRVQSDRKGAYATKVVNKVKQVTSLIFQDFNGSTWSLTTYYTARSQYVASDRTVFFDLREAVPATGGFVTPVLGNDTYGSPVEYGQVTSHLTARCSLVNVDMLKIPVGWTASCPGAFRFRAPDGQWYRLSFQPENYPGVDRLDVTCTAADTTGCKVWTIAPGATAVTGTDPNAKSLNKLLLIDSGGNIIAEGGDYHLSFSITVAR